MHDTTPWLFIHVMKTAGTSFRAYVEKIAPSQVFPSKSDRERTGGNYMGALQFLTSLSSGTIKPDSTPYMFGHFPAWMSDKVDPSWRVATVLREPVARTVSMLGHHNARLGAKYSDLRDLLLDDNFRKNNLENYQTKVFGAEPDHITSANDQHICTEETYEAALERIGRFDMVGLTEEISQTVDRWHEVTDLPRGEFPHFNKAKPREIDTELRDAILPYVQLDLRFYDTVKSTIAVNHLST
ncbi:hypothetical protein [uncultured Tateyamaria sp.]|uniref:hypothetical protein n=1 Tax=uncultured Tateyamaria sp. TaxID=455651 RepID=UPI0026023F4E|nr:hypothetical protein [uncultured Tateyamaria sp.]